MTTMLILEWLGSCLSVGGAVMMASGVAHRQLAWACWVAANLCLIAVAIANLLWGVLVMQIAFLFVNLWGLTREQSCRGMKPAR